MAGTYKLIFPNGEVRNCLARGGRKGSCPGWEIPSIQEDKMLRYTTRRVHAVLLYLCEPPLFLDETGGPHIQMPWGAQIAIARDQLIWATGHGEDTVKRAIGQLVSHGLITAKRPPVGAYTYTMLHPARIYGPYVGSPAHLAAPLGRPNPPHNDDGDYTDYDENGNSVLLDRNGDAIPPEDDSNSQGDNWI